MKSIIINLKRETARRRHAEAECRRCRLVPDFLDATDARALTPQWIARNTTPEIRRWLEDTAYHSMNPNALACADSHRRAAERRLAAPGDGPALILEDDFFSLTDGGFARKKLDLVAESDFDIVLLGYSPRQPFCPKPSEGRDLGDGFHILPYEQVGRTSGAYAYMITRKAAERLLASQAQGIAREADDFAHVFALQRDHLRMGIVFPPLLHSGLFASSIWPRRSGNVVADGLRTVCGELAKRSQLLRRVYVWLLRRRLARRYVAGGEGHA